MSQDYKRLNHSVSLLNYHFVWIPKRRQKVLVGKVAERLQTLLQAKCQELGLEIIALESCSPWGYNQTMCICSLIHYPSLRLVRLHFCSRGTPLA